MSRAKETFVTLLLLCAVVIGIMYLLALSIDRDQATMEQLFNVYSYYLPFLYSCVSFLGVLLLLLCTPLGFVRLFTLVGDLVTRPQFMRDLEEDYAVAVMEEASVRAKLVSERAGGRLDMVNMAPVAMERGGLRLRQGEVLEYLEKSLEEVVVKREGIQRARSRGALSRRLGWPLAMLALIALTRFLSSCKYSHLQILTLTNIHPCKWSPLQIYMPKKYSSREIFDPENILLCEYSPLSIFHPSNHPFKYSPLQIFTPANIYPCKYPPL